MSIASEASPHRVKWRPIILIIMMYSVVGFGYSVSTAAQLRLLEDIICSQYYTRKDLNFPGGNIPEKLCKVVVVQEALAELLGWQAFFDGVPGLILAMPYGVVADKFGRRLVLVASMFGLFLGTLWIAFVCWTGIPVKLIWLSCTFVVIGGGSTVSSAISMTILTDATPEDQRSRFFFHFLALGIIVELIAPPVGSFLMEINVWIPLLIQLACSFVVLPLVMLVPETRVLDSKGDHQFQDGIPEPPSSEDSDSVDSSNLKLQKIFVFSIFHHCLKTAQFVIHDRSVMFLVITFLVNSFGRQSQSLILQYVSKRYSWALSKTSYLLSLRAAAQLVLFAVVLPGLDVLLIKKLHMAPKVKDLKLARLSILLVPAGFTLIAFATEAWVVITGLALCTLGSGFGTFVRSLVSSLVEQKMLGTLYTALSVMDTTGALLAGPLVAKAFKWGMHNGGVWLGMPYMFSMVLFGSCCLVIFSVKLSIKDEGDGIKDAGDGISYQAVSICEGGLERGVEG